MQGVNPKGQLGAKVWAWGQHGGDTRRVAPPFSEPSRACCAVLCP